MPKFRVSHQHGDYVLETEVLNATPDVDEFGNLVFLTTSGNVAALFSERCWLKAVVKDG